MRRQLVVVDEGPAFSLDADVEFVIGEHPLPGLGSLMAGERLFEFLERRRRRSVHGLLDLRWRVEPLRAAAAARWISRTSTNSSPRHSNPAPTSRRSTKLRAASSSIAGGAILRRVRTARSLSLIMVDNVVSGSTLGGVGLDLRLPPDARRSSKLLRELDWTRRNRWRRRSSSRERDRSEAMAEPVTTVHENRVIADPSQVLAAVVDEATRRGYRVVDLGGALHGDVQDVVDARLVADAESLLDESFLRRRGG